MSIAWLFPGQGSQFVGMSKDVVEASAAARRVWEEADDVLGEKLSTLAFEGPLPELTLTYNAQPAIVAASVALLASIRERVPNLPVPVVAAGHSLGEYSALVASGAMRLRDAIRVVRARGRAMQSATPEGVGAMAAIMGLTADAVEEVCVLAAEGEVVSAANFNAPSQVVISGHAGAVARASALVGERGGKAVALKVSAPFHCALMKPAAEAVERELADVELVTPAFPIVANADARPNRDAALIKSLLVRQVDGPVRWEATLYAVASAGVAQALEIGPGKVLAGLMRRTVKEIRVFSVGDVAAVGGVAAFLESACLGSNPTTSPPPAGSIPPPATV